MIAALRARSDQDMRNILKQVVFAVWLGGRKSRKNLIKEYITETEAFEFGMDDIARLREEMAILIQDLHRIYTQKIEEKKTRKKENEKEK